MGILARNGSASNATPESEPRDKEEDTDEQAEAVPRRTEVRVNAINGCALRGALTV